MLNMPRAAALVLSFPLLAAGCASAPPPAAPPPPPPIDPHGFEADEFLVSDQEVPEDWKGTTWAFLAKMEKPAAAPGGEATFYVLRGSGNTQATKFFWKSHPAAKQDLKAGVLVACFGTTDKDGLYVPPADKPASRNGRWLAGHVTDLADLDKSVVRVGSDRCQLGAMRVLAAGGR